MKTFYIHIGLHKTGTRSLQFFLYENKDELTKYGIYYPLTSLFDWKVDGKNNRAHHLFSFSHHRLLGEDFENYCGRYTKRSLQDLLNELMDEVGHVDCDKIIISSEELGYNDARIGALKKMCSFFRENGHCVKIIVYLRKQEYYAASLYSHALKGRRNIDISEHLLQVERMLDYYYTLSSVCEFVSKEDIIVRIYEKGQLIKNNTVDDFMQSVFSVNNLDEFVFPPRDTNKSYCCDTLEMRRLEVFVDDSTEELPLYHSDISKYLFDYSDFAKSNNTLHPIKEIIPIDARIEMREKYREGNEKIAREFLHRADGILFRETYSEPEVEYAGLTYEKACEIYEYVKTNHQLTNEADQCFRNILRYFKVIEKSTNMLQTRNQALKAKNQALKAELQEIRNSTSWKVTKPLRKMADALRKK